MGIVRHSASISTLILDQTFVCCHVVSMKWEEGADVVDRGGLDDMWPLKIVPSCHGALDSKLGWRIDEAEVGCNVRVLLLARE